MTVLEPRSASARATGRYILIGMITAAPLAVTWIVVDFLFGQMSRIGRPWVTALARAISQDHPSAARMLQDDTFLSVVAAGVVLLALWTLGWAASRVVGRRMIEIVERLITLIPFVEKVYKGTRRFLAVAGGTPEGERRVVLVEFPSRDMKVVGFLTKYMTDSVSGVRLAAVYIPTAPNPTSGYVEIVPMERLVFVDWTFDEAMAFVVTGGSSAPEAVAYSRRES
jgi:uncharacterized membrane protein